jgi:hypothetical protein
MFLKEQVEGSDHLLVVGQKNGEYVVCMYPSNPCALSSQVMLYSSRISSTGGVKTSFCTRQPLRGFLYNDITRPLEIG